MKYQIDNDLHIHSRLSSCSNDPEQTPQKILQSALERGLKVVCLTDHFWDDLVPGASKWYAPQDFAHISQAKPLPKSEQVRFLFGCETDLDRMLTLGLSRERMEEFDFIVIPTTHLHMHGFTYFPEEGADVAGRVKLWIKRLDAVLNMDLPFHKVGIAHLACSLIFRENRAYLEVLKQLPEEELVRLFTKAAALGVGIELNASDMGFADEDAETVLRPFRIAKKCGCKFYLGSDAHHYKEANEFITRFTRAIDLLGLEESDKYII